MALSAEYDVVIAGGGMVGASLALALSYAQTRASAPPLRILVVEAFAATPAQPAVYHPSFDARSTALSYGSRQFFEQIGIWSQLAARASAIEHIHVSDQGRCGRVTMGSHSLGWPALGYVVENAWLGNLLLAELLEKPGVQFISPARVSAVKMVAEGAEVIVDESDKQYPVNAGLLVIADGVQSTLRSQLGIAVTERDYGQRALIANVCFSEPHAGRAYERFTADGAMALLPLADSDRGEPRAALVWTLPEADADAVLSLDEAAFLARLQNEFGYRQGRFLRVGERFSYPLKRVAASEQVRSGVVVMGNAAHSLHPVAGQGFNLALRDCIRLAGILSRAAAKQQRLGQLSTLLAYADAQHSDQQQTIAFSDRLIDVFKPRAAVPSLLRGLGLVVLDTANPFKEPFVQFAAGVQDGVAVTL